MNEDCIEKFSRTLQVLFFLLKSDKWSPYREFCYIVYGKTVIALVFGLLTFIFMPLLFWIVRRSENVMQYCFHARKLGTLRPTGNSEILSSIKPLTIMGEAIWSVLTRSLLWWSAVAFWWTPTHL